MAEALLAGVILPTFLDYLFEKMESADVLSFFISHKLEEEILKKLKITMITVIGLLDHAEEKQITVPAVKKWLHELKTAAFEADDFLDEIAYEELRSKHEAGSPKYEVINFMSAYNPFQNTVHEVNQKLQEVLGTMEYLMKQMKALGLTLREGIGEKPFSQKMPTTSLPDSGVYGREKEKGDIINALRSCNNTEAIGLISIVGAGGIGKTTLARLVYNDSKVHNMFGVKIWVHVSEDFDASKITGDILHQVTSDSETPDTNLQKLQDKLKNTLRGKKFLLVLDDVWTRDEECNKWEDLLKPLEGGEQGSKIVITTRIENAFSAKIHIDITYKLEGLNDNFCWSVLAKYAFDADESPSAYPELIKIGKAIAKKCNGLPLAAKSIGSALRFKRKVAEWKRVSESNAWDVVADGSGLAALKLSYYYLPSHIKQCVAYCAIFPKGFVFKRKLLIYLWSAEGFLGGRKGNHAIEEVGNECIDYLVSISFFQKANSAEACFTMHDVIHELCESVSGEFCFSIKPGDPFDLSTKTRYLSAVDTNDRDYNAFEGLNGGQLLRTFLWIKDAYGDPLRPLNHDFLLRFKRLRVLHLAHRYTLHKLPDSIGNLKHLRYLNLRSAKIKSLPESVCSLYFLETLILFYCQNLTELPANVIRLVNLCYLDIRKTKLRRMPAQMNKLKKLQTLTNFILGRKKWCRIHELGELHNLRGKLRIENLQHVGDTPQVGGDILKEKAIEKLSLKWSGKTKNQDRVLQCLDIPSTVKSLSIRGYEGETFPRWWHDYYYFMPLTELVRLKLSNCGNCSDLPSLGELPSLKELYIIKLDKVKTVTTQFYRGRNPPDKPFRSLQTLRFEKMSEWREWEDEVEAFPCLKELQIENCPKLKKNLPSELPSLTKLYIRSCPQLGITTFPRVVSADCTITMDEDSHFMELVKSSSGQYLTVGKSLDFLIDIANKLEGALEVKFRDYESPYIFPLQLFSKIKRLCISGCPNLKSISAAQEDLMPPLQEIHIYGPTNLSIGPLLRTETIQTVNLKDESSYHPFKLHVCFSKLPSGGLWRMKVDQLPSSRLPETHLAPDVVAAVKEIEIYHGLEFFPPLNFYPQLKLLRIYKWVSYNIFLVERAWRGELTSLDSLTINSCPFSEILPRTGFFSNLTKLVLLNCYNLKSLPQDMHLLFPSLLNLKIIQCPKLESFPLRFLPPKLQLLHIEGCHQLSSLSICMEDVPLPPALTSVTIQNLQSLVVLDFNVLPQLTHLEIRNCPKLLSMSDCTPSNLPSLVSLKIQNCPELDVESYEILLRNHGANVTVPVAKSLAAAALSYLKGLLFGSCPSFIIG